MERQVEMINKLVSSYVQIIGKMTRDYIPKAIMYNIVRNVRRTKGPMHDENTDVLQLEAFVSKDILAHLYALPDPVRMNSFAWR
jgi:hypothetical protein